MNHRARRFPNGKVRQIMSDETIPIRFDPLDDQNRDEEMFRDASRRANVFDRNPQNILQSEQSSFDRLHVRL